MSKESLGSYTTLFLVLLELYLVYVKIIWKRSGALQTLAMVVLTAVCNLSPSITPCEL